MEKIKKLDVAGQTYNMLSAAVLNSIIGISPEDAKKVFSGQDLDIDLNIDLKINGVEVSFRNFVKCIEECYDDNVKRAAVRLLAEKHNEMNSIDKIMDDMNDLKGVVDRHIITTLSKGLDLDVGAVRSELGWTR